VALKLVEPGKRKGNKFYLILGMEAGTQYEVSTRTADKKLAQRRLEELKAEIAAAAPPRGKRITFAQAAQLYKGYAKLKPPEVKRLEKVVAEIGRLPVAGITHADLVTAANRRFPGRGPSSLNRNFMDVAACVLHYAAENGYCEWLRVKKFKTPKAPTRAARPEVMEALIGATDGERQLLLIWLWHQGMRITQTLRVTWEDDVDLERSTVTFWDAKGPRWRTLPLHEEVISRLQAIPEEERKGRVFPWGDRHNVYRWLRPLARRLKVTFTPHMARHALGTALNAEGAGLRTIMGALGHDDVRSSIRYQAAELEIVRAAAAKAPRLRISGKKPASA
jgi:integrase